MVATQHGVEVELDLVHSLEEEACDESAYFESRTTRNNHPHGQKEISLQALGVGTSLIDAPEKELNSPGSSLYPNDESRSLLFQWSNTEYTEYRMGHFEYPLGPCLYSDRNKATTIPFCPLEEKGLAFWRKVTCT